MIENIHIKNFKSIKDTSTDLPKYGAVVGKNGAGKTNFIQSINFLKNLIVSSVKEKKNFQYGLIPHELFNVNDQKANIVIQLKLKNLEDMCYQIEVEIGLSNDKNKMPSFEVIKEKLLKGVDQNQVTIFERDRDGITGKNKEKIPLLVDSDILVMSIYNDPDVNIVKTLFNNIIIPDLDSVNSRDTFVSGSPDETGLASLIVQLKHKDQLAFDNFKKIISKIIPDFSEVVEISYNAKNKSEKEQSYLILLEEKGLAGSLSVESISFGDLRTMYLIATAMNMENGSTLIIEEIENGMHPKRMLDVLANLQTICFKKDLQILYTTHSPRVINDLSINQIVYVTKDSNNGTQLTLLSNSDQNTRIQKVLENGGEITDYLNNYIK